MYQVLARKYRPRNFAELVGQEHVSRALGSALSRGRLHHAYLFTGTRGVGKTTIARILAKCLNCDTGITATPCGVCATCQAIDQGRYIDLIEIDAASRTKVEDTRELLDNVPYAPSQGRYKVYLIDEVHMLSTHSFNALLKTLEEPPEHVKFLLATTDPQKLPVTILSRCLQFSLRPLSRQMLHDHLAHVLGLESISVSDEALWHLAEAAQGSVRDALSLTDQAIAYGQGKIDASDVTAMLGLLDKPLVLALLSAIHARDAAQVAQHLHALSQQAVDVSAVLDQMIQILHEMAISQLLPASRDLQQGTPEAQQLLASRLHPQDLQLYYQIALQGRADLKLALTPQQGFEMCVMRLLAFSPLAADRIPVPKTPSFPATTDAATSDAVTTDSATTERATQVPTQPQDPSTVATSGMDPDSTSLSSGSASPSALQSHLAEYSVSSTAISPVRSAGRHDQGNLHAAPLPEPFLAKTPDADEAISPDQSFVETVAVTNTNDDSSLADSNFRLSKSVPEIAFDTAIPAEVPDDQEVAVHLDEWLDAQSAESQLLVSASRQSEHPAAQESIVPIQAESEPQPKPEPVEQDQPHQYNVADTLDSPPGAPLLTPPSVHAGHTASAEPMTEPTSPTLTPFDILAHPEVALEGAWTPDRWECWLRSAAISGTVRSMGQLADVSGTIGGPTELVIPQHHQLLVTEMLPFLEKTLKEQWPETTLSIRYAEPENLTPVERRQHRLEKAEQEARRLILQDPVLQPLFTELGAELTEFELKNP